MTGFNSVTFRKKTIDKILRLAEETKCECIEWTGDVHVTDVNIAKETAKKCDDLGIVHSSYGSYYRTAHSDRNELKRYFEICSALGADTLRIWAGNKGSAQYSDDEWKAVGECITKDEELAAKYGITLAFEFHPNTLTDSGKAALRLLELCNTTRTYWQPRYLGKDEENLACVAHIAKNVHLFYWDLLGARRCLLSKGERKVQGFVDTLKANGFNGNYYLEFCKNDDEDCFRKDMQTLLKLTK
ncbi:MAG: TIM barrel protein [Clostridia bacterium]|nr:TIM barrel protein [Clostridia bacterium]